MSEKKDLELVQEVKPDDIEFETGYVLWFHDVTEKSWEADSYTNLCQDLPGNAIKSVKQLWGIYKTLHNNFTAGMFFLMREGVLPMWEDPSNKNGGYWSFKVPKKNSNDVWKNITAGLVGNALTKDSNNMTCITGISISPKISNCVMKIWNNNHKISDRYIFEEIDYLDPESVRYNKHKK
jgi:hypothetical protein